MHILYLYADCFTFLNTLFIAASRNRLGNLLTSCDMARRRICLGRRWLIVLALLILEITLDKASTSDARHLAKSIILISTNDQGILIRSIQSQYLLHHVCNEQFFIFI